MITLIKEVLIMINREFVQNLTPVEVEFLSGYITSLLKEKVTDDLDNHTNLDGNLKCCPKCGSVHFVKNGFNPNHRQKYRCKDCRTVFLSTTGSVFSYSRLNYNDWTSFIASEINGLTLMQQSVSISRSVTTCFYMRHKLYKAIETLINSQTLKGEIKMDFAYFKINLKGTKKDKMPRISKKRGKSDKHKSVKGLSSHKICVFTAIDSYDNALVKIAGLGSESYEKLSYFKTYFQPYSTIIADSKSSNIKFAKLVRCNTNLVPSGAHLTKDGNHINDINQLHQELKALNAKYHGVSTRHLQGYLDFKCFLKKLIYSTEAKRRKVQAYMDIFEEKKKLSNKDICKCKMPINLYEAYGEYNYGIYALMN